MNEEIMNEIQPVRPKRPVYLFPPSMRGVLPQYRRLCHGGKSGRPTVWLRYLRAKGKLHRKE